MLYSETGLLRLLRGKDSAAVRPYRIKMVHSSLFPTLPRSVDWRYLWRRHDAWVSAAFSAGLLLLAYGFILRLPFFYDDLPIMTWLSRHNWLDIWLHSSENAHYRPLAFTVYKLGMVLPVAPRQVLLHAIPLIVHWISALFVFHLVKLFNGRREEALLAGSLFAVFPFNYHAIPSVTALSHPLVTALTLAAVFGALRAVRGHSSRWWAASLSATALAPFAHESGSVCGLIVFGVILIQNAGVSGAPRFLRAGWHDLRYLVRRLSRDLTPMLRMHRQSILALSLGVVFNMAVVLLWRHIPGVREVRWLGLHDWLENSMFFLHGLLYPVAPVIGWLVNQQGAHDFTLIGFATILFLLVTSGLARRNGDWRWVAQGLWWWGLSALPAAVSLRFSDLFIAPRLHALSSAGIVILWAGVILRLGRQVRLARGRQFVWGILAGAILIQNLAFLGRQRALFTTLGETYRRVLDAARVEADAPLGFVNVPAWLAHREQVYPVISEGVEFVPADSSVGEFIWVNLSSRDAEGVMFTPVLQETAQVFGVRGADLNWEEMRQFAIDRRTVWRTYYEDGAFIPRRVGSILEGTPRREGPLVYYQGGPSLESAEIEKRSDGRWALYLAWWAAGPVDGEIFVHVQDPAGNLVAQADGPALGGTVPLWLWQAGDRIYEVRYLWLPGDSGPYEVRAGVYNAAGRFPAIMGGGRVSEDAATVVTIEP
jgi:hypothetical protein